MFNRTDRSMISIWWWTIDRWLLGSVVILMIAGVFMVTAASRVYGDGGKPIGRSENWRR